MRVTIGEGHVEWFQGEKSGYVELYCPRSTNNSNSSNPVVKVKEGGWVTGWVHDLDEKDQPVQRRPRYVR